MTTKRSEVKTKATRCLKDAKAYWGTRWVDLSTSQREGELAKQLVGLLVAQELDGMRDPLNVLDRLQQIASEAMRMLEEESNR